MISEHELCQEKRTPLEDSQNEVKVQELQLFAVLHIIKRELTPEELARVDHCIRQEIEPLPSIIRKQLRRQ